MSNKVPCGGFTLGDGLYMDGTTLRGGVFYTVKKSEMTQESDSLVWEYEKQLTDEEEKKMFDKYETLKNGDMYVMFIDDSQSNTFFYYPLIVSYSYKYKSIYMYTESVNKNIGNGFLSFGGSNHLLKMGLYITPTSIYQRFFKAGGTWRTYPNYNFFNTNYTLFSIRQSTNDFQLEVDGKVIPLISVTPNVLQKNRGTPTYYFYSNPITADDSSSYYYRVTFSPDNSVTVDKITFANTSVESV